MHRIFLSQAIAGRETVLYNDYPSMLIAINNIASVFGIQEKYDNVSASILKHLTSIILSCSTVAILLKRVSVGIGRLRESARQGYIRHYQQCFIAKGSTMMHYDGIVGYLLLHT
jgi:hypothetical protein